MRIFAPQQARTEELTSSGGGIKAHSGGGANVAGVAWNFMRSSAHPARAEESPQTQLTVGKPGDAQEVEADRVSDEIMRMPVGGGAGRGSPDGKPGGQGGEEGAGRAGRQVQRVAAVNTSLGSAAAPPSVERVLRSPGEMLDLSTRAFMEPRFGLDFSHVRIHSDPGAAQSAESVRARAYAVGSHIAFGPGEYAPQTNAGRSLLAHELVHVVQQSGAPPMLRRKPKGMGAADQSVPRDVSGPLGQPLTEDEMLQMIIKARAEALGESISLIWNNRSFLLELAKRELKLAELQQAKSAAEWNEHMASQHMKGPRDPEYTKAVQEAKQANTAVNEAQAAVLRLQKARAIGTLEGGGAAAGTGQITYAVIQVTNAEGKRIALRLDTTGADGHAEERIIKWLEKTFEGRLKLLEGARIQVVGDQVVCEQICEPALVKFATRLNMRDVIATVFRGVRPTGEVVSPRTYVRTSTEPIGAQTTTLRETKVVYQSPEAKAAAENAPKTSPAGSATSVKAPVDPSSSGKAAVTTQQDARDTRTPNQTDGHADGARKASGPGDAVRAPEFGKISDSGIHASVGEPTGLPTTCVAPGEAARGRAEGFGAVLLAKQFANLQEAELDKIAAWRRDNSYMFYRYWAQGLDPVVTIVFEIPNTIEVLDLAFGVANQMQLLRFKAMRISGEQPSRRERAIPNRAPSKAVGTVADKPDSYTASSNSYTGLAPRVEKHMTFEQDLKSQMGDKYAMYGKPNPGYHFDETTETEYSPEPYTEPTPEIDLPAFPGALQHACAVHGYPDPKMDWSKPLIRAPQLD